MNVKVQELMTESVVTTQPHKSIEHARKIMERNQISAIPVVDSEGRPIGIVSATDLVPGPSDQSPSRRRPPRSERAASAPDDVAPRRRR